MGRKSCEGCRYYKDGNGSHNSGKDRFCHYMIETDKPRNCDPAKCDKKIIDEPYPYCKRRKWINYFLSYLFYCSFVLVSVMSLVKIIRWPFIGYRLEY